MLYRHHLGTALLLFTISTTSYSQVSSRSIDLELSGIYKNLQNPDNYELRHDSLTAFFKERMKAYLSSPLTFDHKLDSLETLITIRQSHDKKIKFYSWDELTRGTWHDINAYAQFRSGNAVSFQQIDNDEEMEDGGFTDSQIYAVHQVTGKSSTFYITFGWGTHGSGNQHSIIQVFTIESGKLIKCRSFDNGKSELVIEHSRSAKAELEFNQRNNSISFKEFKQTDNEPFASETGKRVVLVFDNGSFK